MDSQARGRATLNRLIEDYYDRRVLDPYLRLNSPTEEEAYRRR